MRQAWVAAIAGVIAIFGSFVSAEQPLYGQCGGVGWTGPTTCIAGAKCTGSTTYSQCLPSTTTAPVPITTTFSSSSAVRTSPPGGALVVRKYGTKSGEYTTISAAVAALGSGTTAKVIFIYQGTYNERVQITYPGPLTIYGYTTNSPSYINNTVTIQHASDSLTAGHLDDCATLQITNTVTNIQLYNINVKNTYGRGAPAIAMSAKSAKLGAYSCVFYGYQDTLYAAQGKQYYANCYIEGAVDYIFGGATAWFHKCTIASNGAGFITANGREVSTDPSWYVFNSCIVKAAARATVPAGSVYLGRPWRVLARVLFQKCSLPNIINSYGWTTMYGNANPLYYEYQNTGAGASTSGRQYLTGTTTTTSISTLFQGDTSFIDVSYPA